MKSLHIKQIVILFIVFVAGINSALAERGLLWEISGKNLPAKSYLFGTIHDDDPRVIALHPSIKKAFEQSESFSAEVMLDAMSVMTMGTMMLSQTAQPLKADLTENEYQQCISILAGYGIPEMMLDHMAPWAIATTISLPNKSTAVVLDMKLYMDAQAAGKKVYGLETVQEQMGTFTQLSRKEQIVFLKQAIKDHHKVPQMYAELLKAYLDRDLDALQAQSEKYNQDSDEELKEFFENELLSKRNKLMHQRMQARLNEGRAFIAVGALHLPGDTGLINLLRQQGYQVRSVY